MAGADWYIGGRSDDGSHVDIRQPGRGTAVCNGVPARAASVVIEEHNREVERLRAALEECHRYGLNVAGCAEAYGETESAHLWNEIAAIAEEALWPKT